jgi:hypothetical protein
MIELFFLVFLVFLVLMGTLFGYSKLLEAVLVTILLCLLFILLRDVYFIFLP